MTKETPFDKDGQKAAEAGERMVDSLRRTLVEAAKELNDNPPVTKEETTDQDSAEE